MRRWQYYSLMYLEFETLNFKEGGGELWEQKNTEKKLTELFKNVSK